MAIRTTDARDDAALRWVKGVSELQSSIHRKLLESRYLQPDQDDLVSHHLAEVCYEGSLIATRLVPAFLAADGNELAEISVDLVEDMRSLKESIEAMEDQLVLLMNHYNN